MQEESFSVFGTNKEKKELLFSCRFEEGAVNFIKEFIERPHSTVSYENFYIALTQPCLTGTPPYTVVNKPESFQAFDKTGNKISRDIKVLL